MAGTKTVFNHERSFVLQKLVPDHELKNLYEWFEDYEDGTEIPIAELKEAVEDEHATTHGLLYGMEDVLYGIENLEKHSILNLSSNYNQEEIRINSLKVKTSNDTMSLERLYSTYMCDDSPLNSVSLICKLRLAKILYGRYVHTNLVEWDKRVQKHGVNYQVTLGEKVRLVARTPEEIAEIRKLHFLRTIGFMTRVVANMVSRDLSK